MLFYILPERSCAQNVSVVDIDYNDWQRIEFENFGVNSLTINNEGAIFVSGNEHGGYGLCDVYRSTDDGITWERFKSPLWYGEKITSYDDKLYVVTHKNEYYYSEDEGESWIKVYRDLPSGNFHQIYFGPNLSLAFPDGRHSGPNVLEKVDESGGWINRGSISNSSSMRDPIDFIMVGKSSYEIANSNISRYKEFTRPRRILNQMSYIYNNWKGKFNYYITSGYGKPIYTGDILQVSYDNGMTWNAVETGKAMGFKDLFQTDTEGELVGWQKRYLNYTLDTGKTWVMERLPENNWRVEDFSISNNGTAYLIASGTIVVTGENILYRRPKFVQRKLIQKDPSDYISVLQDVPLIGQKNNYTCWAASIAMMKSWKQNEPLTIHEVLFDRFNFKTFPYWLDYVFSTDGIEIYYPHLKDGTIEESLNVGGTGGLDRSEWEDFYEKTMGLTGYKMSYSLSGILQLLQNKGPLLVSIDPVLDGETPGGHSIVVTGMYGDGSAEKTFVRYNDPWRGGTVKEESFSVFTLKMMEALSSSNGANYTYLYYFD